uniref:SMI1/KNR4 family protein n=1 Tax=Paractinoplanes polyasparticus TaxID=2856853 RepID=UPI001C840C5F|nr:SMI1/KNR4 family protein [Actinoplanes polyasparticus]
MMTGVEQTWERLAAWFETNAPRVRARLAEPATDADLRAVEKSHGRALPADLAESWRCVNGVLDGRGDLASIMPGGHYPTSTAGAIRNLELSTQILTEAADQDPDDEIFADITNGWAGDTSDAWAHPPSWIVISEGPDRLFVDCRKGSLYGCVMKMLHSGGQIGPLWPNVAAMLAETADVLESINASARPCSVEYSGGEWPIPSTWWSRDE